MAQSSIEQQSISYISFLWLIEDWQGCKFELAKLRSMDGATKILASVVEAFFKNELRELLDKELKSASDSNELKTAIMRFVRADIQKKILRIKLRFGFAVSDNDISKLICELTGGAASSEAISSVLERLELHSSGKQFVLSNSFNEWTSLQKSNGNKYIDQECLKEAKNVYSNLGLSNKNSVQGYRFLAYALVGIEEFEEAIELYNVVESNVGQSEALAIKIAQAHRNNRQICLAIQKSEQAVNRFGRNPQLLYILATYYRDNQEFEKCIELVHEIIQKNSDYSMKLGFATFAADMLRKNSEYKLAYSHLKKSVENDPENVPLTTKAVLSELKSNVESGIEEWSEVSSVFYDTVYRESTKYAADAEDSIYLPLWKSVINQLKTNGVQRVIDIGCGPGQFAEYLSNQMPGIEYLGLDFSETAISSARKRCPHLNFKKEDVRMHMLGFNEDKCAYIMLEVLEHIDKDIELLNIFPEDSLIIYSLPNFDSFGHVRFYPDIEDIEERYKLNETNSIINEVNINYKISIFLVTQYRKNLLAEY